MRLAIVSDIHGNHEALKRVLLDIEKSKIDEVIFLGDLVMKGPEPREVFESLKELKPICWLKGNTELWLSKNRTRNESNSSTLKEIELYRSFALKSLSKDSIDFMLSCPEKHSMIIKNIKMLFVHGSPRSIIEALTPEADLKEVIQNVNEDIILCGHSHLPFIKRIGSKVLFNPGSVGCPYDGDPRASYGILNISNLGVSFCIKRVNYSIERLLASASKVNFPYIKAYEKALKKGRKINELQH